MAKCRNRKRPVPKFPPDPDVTVKVMHRPKDTKRWCKGIVGREHCWVEALNDALHYAEVRTGLMDSRRAWERYGWGGGDFWYYTATCTGCGQHSNWREYRRQLWCTPREYYTEIPYHWKRLGTWEKIDWLRKLGHKEEAGKLWDLIKRGGMPASASWEMSLLILNEK